jgi:hypothetical protein
MNTTAPVIALDHPAALDAARVGRMAADLAAARAAGLPAASGVVLTTDWSTHDEATARQVWRITSHDGARPLTVRPSSARRTHRVPSEHAIEPVIVVRDADAMLAAIVAIRRADPTIPVLLQPESAAAWRGALFGDDSGERWRSRPIVVARAADGVGDGSSDWIAELDQTGRVRAELSAAATEPPAAVLARLSRLATKVADTFGGPHDLDWTADSAGRLQLLRVRPVLRVTRGLVPGPDEIVAAA